MLNCNFEEKLMRQVVVKYPPSYTEREREKLEESIQRGIKETGIVLVPEDVDIAVLPVN